jgi:ferredoxin
VSRLYVTFIDKEGDEHKLAVNKGDNLLTIAQSFDIEMEGKFSPTLPSTKTKNFEGACEGSCSCSTCHVIVEDEAMYDKMEEATDDENDMLDLAFGLTETSRLGCQIVMSKELDGLRVRLPSMTRNLQASDFDKKN